MLPRSSVYVAEGTNLLSVEIGLPKIRTTVSKIRPSSEAQDDRKSYSCSTSELRMKSFLSMCSFPFMYITVNVMSSPVPRLETHYYLPEIREVSITCSEHPFS